MIVTKKALNRRTILRGIGAALALPLLDSMAPALRAAPKTIPRFGAVYVPNGINMSTWTPSAEGATFDFTPALAPLEPFRDRLLVLSGLNSNLPAKAKGPAGIHARACTRFLTDVPPKPEEGADLQAGASIDQLLARESGRETQLASLELGLETTESVGACDPGFNCAYTGTISWRDPHTPLPMEINPRVIFERMFGDSANTDPAARRERMERERSILDSVMEKVARMERQLGPADCVKLDQYLDSIRDIERRIQKAESQSAKELPVLKQPSGVPASFDEHAALMYDLFAIAFQTDLTRVVTFMIGHEYSGRTHPEIGVTDAHHAISHHKGDPTSLAKLTKVDKHHVELFAKLLEKLKATPDGDGSLLDHALIVYGSGMSDGNAHDPKNLPIVVAGGGAGLIRPGRHLRFPKDTPLANLHLTLMDKLGVRLDKIGDSTGEFPQLSEIG
jgi:Protein of unknown function (DUF1552)